MSTVATPLAIASPAPGPQRALPHVTVCICTLRRPALLRQLLDSVAEQLTEDRFTFSVVVADNDANRSAEPVVAAFRERSSVPIAYGVEPVPNIALTRNRALSQATGDYIAFIDDDECPVPDWLRLMLNTCECTGAAGVLGPVRPRFEAPPPAWVIRGRFCERPEHPTGTLMPWNKSRTGNLLFRREILTNLAEPFRPQFGTGGEDVDFFQRMAAAHRSFVWCNEAATYESVPLHRCTRSYMLKRALIRGRANYRLPGSKTKAVLKSLIAVPAYLFALPATLVCGQHIFIQCCIRLCDHLGRVLAPIGIQPVKQRAD